MPVKLVCCVSLPPATLTSVPIANYAEANKQLAKKGMEQYYSCCGKTICRGCIHSFNTSGYIDNCPYCNSDRSTKTNEETFQEMMKRVEVNDAASINVLASFYHHGQLGLQQDRTKAMRLMTKAAELGSSQAHFYLGNEYGQGGDIKKAKFHFETAAMAGHEVARNNLGSIEAQSGNMEQAVKHWIIAASAGYYTAMHILQSEFEKGHVSRNAINSTLTAYNNSCAEMRSKARDACFMP
jgi:TPR repeat protein